MKALVLLLVWNFAVHKWFKEPGYMYFCSFFAIVYMVDMFCDKFCMVDRVCKKFRKADRFCDKFCNAIGFVTKCTRFRESKTHFSSPSSSFPTDRSKAVLWSAVLLFIPYL